MAKDDLAQRYVSAGVATFILVIVAYMIHQTVTDFDWGTGLASTVVTFIVPLLLVVAIGALAYTLMK